MIKPAPGDLLIAAPFLNDSNFERSVILLCEQNTMGSFGLILNQPIELCLHDVLEEIIPQNIPLLLGGPVENDTLHYFHRRPDLIKDSRPLTEGVYWGGNFDVIRDLINSHQLTSDDIRFFIGYSGWSAGQLEEEMETDTWIVSSNGANFLFKSDYTYLWSNVLKALGGKYKSIAHYPIDPRLN